MSIVSAATDAEPDVPAARAWVVCLCAEWCSTCRDYRPLFVQAAAEHPGWRFAWVDIEDHSDIADDFDVETFPTLLLVDDAGVRFLGPMLPHVGQLVRLVQHPPAARPADEKVQLLVAALAREPGAFAAS